MTERKQGNSALRVKHGKIEKFNPHPATVEPDSADWWRSVAQGLGVKLHAAEEVLEAWRLFAIGQSSKVRPERMMKEYAAKWPAAKQAKEVKPE